MAGKLELAGALCELEGSVRSGASVNYTQGRLAWLFRRVLSFPRICLYVVRTLYDRPISFEMSDVRACSPSKRFWHPEGTPVTGSMSLVSWLFGLEGQSGT